MSPEKYVERLIDSQREGMIDRASWVDDHRPQYSHGMAMFGGKKALVLYEDAQLCYIYGMFSGAIMLGQSFIEQSICAMAYDVGEFTQDDRPGYHDAVDFLVEENILEPDEVEGIALDELHNLRNPIAHFRPPTDEGSLSGRKMENVRNEPESIAPTTDEMLKEDSEKVLKTIFSVSHLYGVGYQSN